MSPLTLAEEKQGPHGIGGHSGLWVVFSVNKTLKTEGVISMSFLPLKLVASIIQLFVL